jgi:hypothetical protein
MGQIPKDFSSVQDSQSRGGLDPISYLGRQINANYRLCPSLLYSAMLGRNSRICCIFTEYLQAFLLEVFGTVFLKF